jgi:ubiquinone/menaquinone biosynthesis C-methylase UbiE
MEIGAIVPFAIRNKGTSHIGQNAKTRNVMLPKTRDQEYEHRKRKRELEVDIIIESIMTCLRRTSVVRDKTDIDIFEFGTGDGFQIAYLTEIGNVVASDIYTSDGVKRLKDIKFIECSITDAPFRDGQFHIVFASQVIPDLTDIKNGLRETQRIGKSSSLYAFSVPTNLWLLLSLPALYYNKLRNGVTTYQRDSKLKKFLRTVLPEGRGRWNFLECYRNFKIRNWQRLFTESGFSVIEVKPLLLYGPSEWPIIPTSTCKTNFCSSVLFLMMKRQNPLEPAQASLAG